MAKLEGNINQTDLFVEAVLQNSLLVDYVPIRPNYFNTSRIYLTKGSISTPARRQFIKRGIMLFLLISTIPRLPETVEHDITKR